MWYHSVLGGRGTISIPVDANPDGKITYREVPIEIICAAESPIAARPQKIADTCTSILFRLSFYFLYSDYNPDSPPETYYHVNMMTFDGCDGGSDGEIDAELEREREALEEQRDMYRGDNIDDLLPEELFGQDEDHEDEENASDENGIDGTEEDNNVACDSPHHESTEGKENDEESENDTNSDDKDNATAIAAKIAVSTTPDLLVPPVIPPKVSNNSNYAGPPGSLPESSHVLISAQRWPTEQYADVIGDQLEGEGVHEGDQNLSVSQYIKRMYLNQKWHHHQARIMWQQHHKANQPFPEPHPRTVYKPEEWECDDHVIVPQHYDHLLGAPFDLQQMNWYERTGITPLEARRTRDRLYQNYQELKNSNADVSPSHPLQQSMLTLAELPTMQRNNDWSALRAPSNAHQVPSQHTPFPAPQSLRRARPSSVHLLLRQPSMVRIQLELLAHQNHGRQRAEHLRQPRHHLHARPLNRPPTTHRHDRRAKWRIRLQEPSGGRRRPELQRTKHRTHHRRGLRLHQSH
jgi:hypothetical protein